MQNQNKKKKWLGIGCLIYILFGFVITYLYYSRGGDLFKQFFDWRQLFNF